MADDEQIGEEGASGTDADDVEAHGAKKIVGTGLAAAALLGAGAAGVVKLAGDDDQSSQRVAGALTSREDAAGSSLARADTDRDGYLSYRELAHEGYKWSVDELDAEVTAEGLAAAGYKFAPRMLGERGFLVKGDTIMLKAKVDKELDAMVAGSALEWTIKLREIDRDGDGLAGYEELMEAGFKYDLTELKAAGYDVTAEDLAKAGYKVELESFGAGGFAIKGESIFIKQGVDSKLDELFHKQ